MVDSPDTDLASDPKLSAKEVTEILQPNHALSAGPLYDADWKEFGERPSDYYRSLISRIRSYRPIEPHLLSDPLSDACKQFRGRILKWFCNSSRDRSLFWVTDPFARHPELTVAQTFTGIFTALNRLGANPWIRTGPIEPNKVILQVVKQLASQYPLYPSLLTRELTEDPTIVEKSPHTLFRKLIVEPWDILAAYHPLYLQLPPLIILVFEWDPKCTHGPHFAVLIELIQKYSSRHKTSPLLWLICTHPYDRQLNQPLLRVDGHPVYEHGAWTYDSTEAEQDANNVLHCGFQRIREDHPTAFVEDEEWPLDAQLNRLASVICGVPHFACSVVDFVGAKGKDPKQKLETCIEYMTGCPRPSTLDPFSGLGHFYCQMVSNLPPDALDILHLSSHPVSGHHTCAMANLLRIARIEFYDLMSENLDHLLTLHPCDNSEYGHKLRFRGRAFKLLLQHSSLSGLFSDRDALLVRLFLPYLPYYGTFSAIVNAMSWKPSRPKDLWREVHSLQQSVHQYLWYHASRLDDGGYSQLNGFDFRHLVPISARIAGTVFYNFLLQLRRGQPKDEHPLVRTTPVYPSDQGFVERCNTVAIPMNFSSSRESPGTSFPQYAMVGHGIQTVLVISCWDPNAGARGTRSVDIYSLDMLGDL